MTVLALCTDEVLKDIHWPVELEKVWNMLVSQVIVFWQFVDFSENPFVRGESFNRVMMYVSFWSSILTESYALYGFLSDDTHVTEIWKTGSHLEKHVREWISGTTGS